MISDKGNVDLFEIEGIMILSSFQAIKIDFTVIENKHFLTGQC